MIMRLSKALMVCAIALFATLVVFGNMTDYNTNFVFVHHVLQMDTISLMPPLAIVRSTRRGYNNWVISALSCSKH